MQIDYDPKVIQDAMGQSLGVGTHTLKFVGIGDNDGFDCQHSQMDFDLQISYVLKLQTLN